MIMRIARRDLIKSWKRSGAIASAVALSVALLVIGGGYMDGFIDKFYSQAIRETGHVMITAPGYKDKLDMMPLTPNLQVTDSLLTLLRSTPHVKNIRPMLRYGALANSENRTLEMSVVGSTPKAIEIIYSRLEKAVVQGHFLDGNNQIMIGTEAAHLLDVKAGDKLILLTSDVYGGMSAIEPEIVGVFESLNLDENSITILADLQSSQKLLALEGRATEISLELDSHDDVDRVIPILKHELGAGYDVSSWKENQAALISMLEIAKVGTAILYGIIIVVAALGMINTFLISVLERMPEFGTLRAIGLRSGQLMRLVVLQGFILGIVGTIVGLILGLPVVFYFQAHPFDLGEAMQSVKGIDSMLWFTFRIQTVTGISLLGIIIAVLASLYPAYYVGKQKPVEVLRNIA